MNHTLRDSVLSALAEGIEQGAQRITIEVRRQTPDPNEASRRRFLGDQ